MWALTRRVVHAVRFRVGVDQILEKVHRCGRTGPNRFGIRHAKINASSRLKISERPVQGSSEGSRSTHIQAVESYLPSLQVRDSALRDDITATNLNVVLSQVAQLQATHLQRQRPRGYGVLGTGSPGHIIGCHPS